MFPNNGSDDEVPGPATGWGHWLGTEDSQATPEAAGQSPAADAGQQPRRNGAEVKPAPTDSAWSQWLQNAAPADQDSPAEASPDSVAPVAPRKNRRALVFAGGGVVAAVGAVAAGVVALMSTTQTPAPALSAPAVSTPPASATTTTPVDPVLGGGPGCEPTRTPKMVRGNGTGSMASGPDVILAFQHAYYVTRSGAAARTLTAPDAQVSPVEAIDAGIATIPAGTRYCLTITPAETEGTFTVVVIETRPDAQVRTYPQVVSVASHDNKTLITRIGAVE